MKQLLVGILIAILFISCQNNVEDQQNAMHSPVTGSVDSVSQTTKTNSSKELSDFLSPNDVSALHAIKKAFDVGLSSGNNNPDLGDIYHQHAIRMKLNFLNQEPYNTLYPYNNTFDLSEVGEAAAQTQVFSHKCGFLNQQTKETFHHYCLDVASPYFDYLAHLATDNTFIDHFQKRYREVKTIGQEAKQAMLLNGDESLDFSLPAHQMFYMLFHIVVNEERMALEKYRQSLASGK